MFDRNKTVRAELLLIHDELRHRSTPRASILNKAVVRRLKHLGGKSPAGTAVPPAGPAPATRPLSKPVKLEKAPRMTTPLTPQQRSWLHAALARLRDKLIDLGKRNPLVSFKHSERGASFLRVIDEAPDVLFQALQAGAMTFEPLPAADEIPKDEQTPQFRITWERSRLTDPEYLRAVDGLGESEADEAAVEAAERLLRARVRAELGLPKLDPGRGLDIAALARAHGFDPSFELAEQGEAATGHRSDSRIRVLLTADRLEARLRTIQDRYRGHAAETGLHTLFLAFGFVEWFEDEASKLPLHAPALILPVHLERRLERGRYVFSLTARDEDLAVNVAMRELLRQKFKLEAPALRPDETPESWFIRLAAVLAEAPRLRMSLRRFVTLAVLPFPRMVLWQDLDPALWPDGALEGHPLLPRLLGAADAAGGGDFMADYEIDAPAMAPRVPPLVRDADTSQHSALIDVSEGKSLAIEGPPGTGKSQTIANMIAVALDRGKRVLFVAEKQAALDVVAKRLEDSGLGPLLLQLHSDRATKTELLKSLDARMKARAPASSGAVDRLRGELAEKKALLRRYLALLGTPLGALGRTAHALVWRELSLRERCAALPPAALAPTIDAPERIDALQLKRARDALDNVADKAAEIVAAEGALDASLWSRAGRLHPFDQSAEQAAARAAAAAGAAMLAVIRDAERDTGVALGEADPLGAADALAALPDPAGLDDRMLRAALADPDGTAELLARGRKRDATLAAAETVHPRPLAQSVESVAALEAALDPSQAWPATLDAARLALAEAEGQLAALSRLEQALEPVLARLGLSADTPLATLRFVAHAVPALTGMSEEAAGLRTEKLLDERSAAVVRNGRSEAAQLAAEAAALGDALDLPAALAADPARLDSLAETIETAGWTARLFGGGYKAAWREAARLFRAPPERTEVPAVLRRLARLVAARAAFADTSPARALFGAAQWRGDESDWAALEEAQALLGRLLDEAANARCEPVAETLAIEPMRSLRRLGAAAAAAGPELDALSSLPAASTIAAVRAEAERERARFAKLVAAAETAGLRADAPLRDGDTSAAALIRRAQSAQRKLEEHPREGLWSWFAGAGTNLAPLADARDFALRLSPLPAELFRPIAAAEAPVSLVAQMRTAGAAISAAGADWRACVERLATLVEAAPDVFFGGAPAAAHARIAAAAEDAEGLRRHADMGKYLGEAEAQGCRFVYDAARAAGSPTGQLADAYELMLVRDLLKHFLGGTGAELGRLGGLGLARARARFAALDGELQGLEAERILAERLASDRAPEGVNSGPRGTWTELALIRNEIGKKTKHVPIRDLLKRAGAAVATLKPVWMMSPTSAAQYIQPGSNQFDLVVIDEASQMRPEYAVSAVARGAQLVVVGDSNQLPPTDFFSVAQPSADEEDGEEDYSIDTESILDLANQRLPHKRRLSWHYRSEHESLIQFSNRRFYNGGLVVFPSPVTDDALLGVKHVPVPGIYEAQVNQAEAQAVIVAAAGIMLTRPELSLGIATMNIKQRDLIWAEFERLQAQDGALRSYLERHAGTIEPFFVKNLENVQGDERDVILISTVYGPDRRGHVYQRFGPLASKVGHRRLNVLVTRAKQSTRLFTSLRPSDIKAVETSSEGVHATQAYLTYAAGGATADQAGGGEPDSDFEVFVADRLRAAGYEAVPQVGVEGFRIDIGVRHPSFPLGFIAGVECDGAAFHSAASVRDRDKIRQAVLEKLGWNIYRIWSTDWFADPAAETRRLLTRLEEWRAAAAAKYEVRRQSGEFDRDAAPDAPAAEDVSETPAPAPAEPAAEAAPVEPPAPAPAREPGERPAGKRHKVDGIEFIETMRGVYFEVWAEDAHAGDVEVLSRASAAPRLYGGGAAVQRSQYRGTVNATGASFISDDLYAAVRRVARDAQATVPA